MLVGKLKLIWYDGLFILYWSLSFWFRLLMIKFWFCGVVLRLLEIFYWVFLVLLILMFFLIRIGFDISWFLLCDFFLGGRVLGGICGGSVVLKILIGCFGVGDDVFCIMLFDDLIFKIVEGVEILFGIIVMIFNFFVGIGGFGFGFVFIFWIFVLFINVFVVLILRLFWFGIVC